MSPSSPARTARRARAALVRSLAWLALLGMLLGPLAPRPAAPREAEGVDAELLDAAEVESSTGEATSRVVQRSPRWRVGPPGARRWVHPRPTDARGAPPEPSAIARIGVPRRVAPVGDDPDDHLA